MNLALHTRAFIASPRFAGFVEQGLSSVISMIGLIVLSRLMSIDDFGVLSGAVGIWLIIEMLQHAVTIGPFVVSCPEPRKAPAVFGAWMVWNLVLSVLVGLVFFLVGSLLVPFVPLLGSALILAGPLTVAGMGYMFSRRAQYHLHQRAALLAQAALYGVSYLAGLGLTVLSGTSLTPLAGALILCAAYGVPALVFTLLLLRHARPDRQAWHHIRSAGGLIAQLGAAGMIWQLSYAATLVSLSIWATPAAVAVYSVTRTLVRPVSLLISSISDVDFSRASRAFSQGGIAQLGPIVASSARILTLLAAPPILLLLVIPDVFLHLVYGERYVGSTVELQLWTLLFIPLVYVSVLDIGLTVLRDAAFLIRAHAIGLVICLAVLAASAALGHLTTATALASLVAARAIAVPILYLRYRKLTARKTAPPSPLTMGAAANAP